MYANGNMTGADKIPVTCNKDAKGCPPANAQFKYVDNSTGLLDPYFQLAEQYTFGDRMFQTNQGPSFPAHQFIISGTSAPSPAQTAICSPRRIQAESRMPITTLGVPLLQANS